GRTATAARSSVRYSWRGRTLHAFAKEASSSNANFSRSLFFCQGRGRWKFSPMITNKEDQLRQSLTFTDSTIPERISADPEVVENGLARLVLSIIELVRRLLEKQALRRMDAGNLTEEEIERLGTALMKLEEKMIEMKEVFGLEDDDLNLSLGPVRTLD